jgi:carboxynorspermidine decarboxylase
MPLNSITTPYYLLEERLLRRNLELIRSIAERAGVEIILAFKAYALWRTFPIFREYIHASTASSPWEARLGYEEMGAPVHAYTPAYSGENIADFVRYSSHITLNSPTQWRKFGPSSPYAAEHISYGLRLNLVYSPVETEIYNPALPGTRFGVSAKMLRQMQQAGELDGLEGVHLHVLCEGNDQQLKLVLGYLEERFGFILDKVQWLNLGGGHLMTRREYNTDHLVSLLQAFRERHPGLRIIMEPGSAFAWQTGDLIASVVDIVSNDDIKTAIMNVSFACHMPDCLEMPYYPTVEGATHRDAPVLNNGTCYRLGGNSCLSGDYMGYWTFDHPLEVGETLIFKDMLHYTTVKTNMFNGVQHPSIALQHLDGSIELLRSFDYSDYKTRMD